MTCLSVFQVLLLPQCQSKTSVKGDTVKIRIFGLLATALVVMPTLASAQLTAVKYSLTKGIPSGGPEGDAAIPIDGYGPSPTVTNTGPVKIGFDGISQYDVASVGRSFIPPDTIGAVGKTQFVQFVNGGYAVYNKADGTRAVFTSDTAFWNSAGQAGIPNGDPRVIYSKAADKFIALSFGPNTKDLLIAVSDTGNAAGTWKSTKFEGFAPLATGARTLADYPTLAFDNKAVYIGTNNFGAATVGGVTNFRGTSLNVIPISSILALGGPTIAGNVRFNTAFTGAPTDDFTRGFAIQGVNSSENTDGIGHIIAASINDYGLTRYDVLNAGTPSAVRTATFSTTLGTDYQDNNPGRQPAADPIAANVAGIHPASPTGIAANRRIIDTFRDQISSSAFESNGKIYSVHTVTNNGTDRTVVRYTVLDTATNVVLDEGSIGDATHDYYQGSMSVNALGEVVISYNRSGLNPVNDDGNITLAARIFRTSLAGVLVQRGAEIVLRVSDTDDYHNGALYGRPSAGRQRWADYASVTLDPTNQRKFWVTGTYAREYNLAAFGHPGGTGGSRWGTYIAAIDAGAVPEPASWAMMIVGFGLVGAATRRQRQSATVSA